MLKFSELRRRKDSGLGLCAVWIALQKLFPVRKLAGVAAAAFVDAAV